MMNRRKLREFLDFAESEGIIVAHNPTGSVMPKPGETFSTTRVEPATLAGVVERFNASNVERVGKD